jgi:predicted DNA-binding transcriptional regulator AlpA
MKNNQMPSFLPTEGFVRLSTVLDHIPVSKSTWWDGVKSGDYPAPVKVSPRSTAWLVTDIRELIDKISSQISQTA